MKRIYDAAFETASGTRHEHLGRFWWVDDSTARGTWTRDEAYAYVLAHPNTVYVSESGESVYVYPHSYKAPPYTKWIQTKADGLLPDNLITLARNH